MTASVDPACRSVSRVLILICLAVLLGCQNYTSLKKPYTSSILNKVKKGDLVKITLNNGVYLEPLTVQGVWADSLLLGIDNHALRIADIRDIKYKPMHLVITASDVVVFVVLALLPILLLTGAVEL